jgi:hypothetical protein
VCVACCCFSCFGKKEFFPKQEKQQFFRFFFVEITEFFRYHLFTKRKQQRCHNVYLLSRIGIENVIANKILIFHRHWQEVGKLRWGGIGMR